MEKWPFFRADMARLGKYHTGGYGRIGVYRVNDIVNQVTFSKIQMYADDIVLYTTVENNINLLQEDIKCIFDWCDGNKLTMNIKKTKYQVFPRNKHVDMDKLSEECKINIGQTFPKEVKL